MFSEIIWIIALTLIPTLELRASIPYGIFSTDMHWSVILMTAVLANIVLGAIVYTLIDKLLHIFIKYDWFKKPYTWYHNKVQNKIEKKVSKFGELGLSLFIGVPLPGSGTYSGAVAAHALGMNFRQFFIANIIGVIIAGVAVTIICLVGAESFGFLLKH